MSLLALVLAQAVAPASDPRALVALELPAVPQETVVLELPCGTAELHAHSLRASGSFVRVVGVEGSVDQAPPAVTTYRGSLRDEAGSAVVASLLPEGWTVWIERADGELHALEPARERGLYELRPAVPPDFRCGASDAPVTLGPGFEAFSTRENRRRCLRRAEVAFDADLQYYQLKGSSVPATVAAIDAILNVVDFFYARDVQITFALTAYVVRTTAFYQPTSGGNLLDLFRTEWTTNQAAIPRDLAHLMTGQPGSLIEFGGLAYVGVTCNPAVHYGWSMDGANIVGHEIGHNFGSGHCHDVEPCNNMCGACFYVGPNTRTIITAYRDAVTCLDLVGSRASNRFGNLAPYAMPDEGRLRKDELATGLALDVVRNDDDGDCEPVRLVAFDATSERGGTITREPLVPGEWRDLLRYQGPAEPFVGLDRFRYEVGDARRTTTGTVSIESLPLELFGYWPLDDGSGTSASDHSRGARAGTLVGGALWDTGRFGGALYFDGINDRVHLPAFDVDTNQLTLTLWVRRQGTQDNFAGLLFSRAGSTVAGLSVTSGGGLRYTWNNDPATYSFATGLVLPDDQWAFVALVIEPGEARLHMAAPSLLTVTRVLHHDPEAFDGRVVIGRDDAGSRDFRGWIDDVRVYDRALNTSEIAVLAAGSSPADAPLPRDGAKVADATSPLAWEPGLEASAHDVYLGTSYASVRAATTGSSEYAGTFAASSLVPPLLTLGTTYFWRVDEHTPGGIEPGAVWQFEPARQHRWRLDETSGSSAIDSVAGLDGSYVNGVALGQPGASPNLGLAALFDGVNDRVSIPPLNLDSDRVTLTCWLKRSGPQNSWAAMLFSRAGTTVAGLHLGTAHELRYTWNDDGGSWGWDSGLVVPDAQWVFAALVIEPTQARLTLGQNGTLASATNAIHHAAEAFDGTLWLGRDPHSSPRHFKGALDDVRVYDHALSEAEVAALYFGSL
jgi:hypothetical protein